MGGIVLRFDSDSDGSTRFENNICCIDVTLKIRLFVMSVYQNTASIEIFVSFFQDSFLLAAFQSYLSEKHGMKVIFEREIIDDVHRLLNRPDYLTIVRQHMAFSMISWEEDSTESSSGYCDFIGLFESKLIKLSLSSLPGFITSISFIKYWNDEVNKTLSLHKERPFALITTTFPDIKTNPNDFKNCVEAISCNTYSRSFVELQVIEPNYSPLSPAVCVGIPVMLNIYHGDPTQDVLDVFDKSEVNHLFSVHPWLLLLLRAIENLPVAMCLSTAQRSRPGFPLLYVNKYFEKLAGFSRSEVIGSNCTFLQRDIHGRNRAEPDSLHRMTSALCNETPSLVQVTNFRKDGTPFKNCVLFKPIFDRNGSCSYVVSLSVETEFYDIPSKNSRGLFSSLMNFIPNAL